MNLQENIEYIRERCIDAIAKGSDMNSDNWRNGEGVFMSFNEAIEIVNEIGRLRGEKATLLAALNDLLDEQNDAPLETRRKEWEAATVKARTAIENAEKTRQ